MQELIVFIVLLAAAGLLYWVNTSFNHAKHKKFVLLGLWIFIFGSSYMLVNSIYDVIQFDDLKETRYQAVIKKLVDIRDSQLAYRDVKGEFQNDWDSLVKFIELDSFTITQRRDSSILDEELTKRYGGVKTYKNIVIIDTIYPKISVEDSLFGLDKRYKNMMYVPYAKDPKTKFILKTDSIPQNGIYIPLFESKISKDIILHDQSKDLRFKENLVKSVDGVNGEYLKVGSITEVNTNGNWPKNYRKEKN